MNIYDVRFKVIYKLPRETNVVDDAQNALYTWNKYTHHCTKFGSSRLQN